MAVTWFLPVFLVFLLYSCKGERQWVVATIVASFFQAASPILVTAGGRINGLQPAYFLIPVGLVFFIRRSLGPKAIPSGGLTAPHLYLFALTIIGVSGALLLPFVFGGIAHVTPPRQQEAVELLHFSTSNPVQAAYMVCNFLLFVLVAHFARCGLIDGSQSIRALAIGTSVTVGLGLYQIYCDPLHLPWPDAVINSNTGSAQLFDQNAVGLVRSLGVTRRMSSTFLEPSMLSTYLIGMLGLFAVALRRVLLGGVILFSLIISTSATATIGIFVVAAVAIVWYAPRGAISLKFACHMTLAAALVLAVFAAFYTDLIPGHHFGFISEKLQSTSGVERSTLDRIALHTFRETWGLGVGLGSTRSSSFLATFTASAGVPGLVCLAGFFGALIMRSYGSQSRELRALGFSLATLFVGWVLSVPDMTLALVWILSGAICGLSARPYPAAQSRIDHVVDASLGLAHPSK